MLRLLSITLVMTLGFTLGGCNRSPVQTAPAPGVHTSNYPPDQVPPPQDTGVRVDADRGDVDVKVDRPGLRGDRKIEVDRDPDGGINIKRERDGLIRDRDIDIKVNPRDGVKVDLD